MKPKKARSRASLAQVSAHAPESLITYRVSVLAQVLSRLVDASVRDTLGLTSRQWRVLVILNRLGTSSSGEVARTANYDHSQVSRVTSELVEKGVITQVSDPGDRRKQLLALTPAGIDLLRNGLPGSLEREARLRSRLSDGEYEVFIRALKVLEDEALELLGEVKPR
ncbi:MarR family winged helix-turn-helix transcriptional regulator [Ramlibacter sp. AN1015]|uniref:MarR family winged helix-turn-helix transcriptional regulator n=1 Tax=Ramlibacter sp. AN1015 TaxID=3133428 RepID=UPI0030C4F37C